MAGMTVNNDVSVCRRGTGRQLQGAIYGLLLSEFQESERMGAGYDASVCRRGTDCPLLQGSLADFTSESEEYGRKGRKMGARPTLASAGEAALRRHMC